VSARVRRGLRVVLGRGRWRAVLLAVAVLGDLPWWAVAGSVLLATPALLWPWRWLGWLAVLALLATQATAVVLAGDDARPWLLPLAASSLLSVLVVEPLERGGDVPVPHRLAAAPRAPEVALVALVLVVAADARPSGALVVVGLAAAAAALAVAVRAHR
jgi:hypothetical protein